MTSDKVIYYSVWNDSTLTDLYKSIPVNGEYLTFDKLSGNINSNDHDNSPYIAKDESNLIFASNRPGGFGYHDLYISFKNSDGSWNSAVNMGNLMNNVSEDSSPRLSSDGKYLFFTSARTSNDYGYNAYWVDAQIIQNVGMDDSGSNSPNGIELFQNYPNPFNPETTITFSLPKAMPVEISIYNVKGEKVAQQAHRKYTSGIHSVRFDAGRLNSGHYFYRLKAGDYTAVKKMMVLK